MTIVYDGPDRRGWLKRQCARCGKKTNWTPHNADRCLFICLAWPESWEWGEWAALILSAFGLNPGRWAWIQNKLGLIEPASDCPDCELRKRWLNTLGGRVVTAWRRFRGSA